MKLSDVVGAAHGLVIYPEVALVLFLVAFTAVLVQLVSGKRAGEWERARSLPLAEGDTRPRGPLDE